MVRSVGIIVEGNDVGSESEKLIRASGVMLLGLNLDVVLKSAIIIVGVGEIVVGDICFGVMGTVAPLSFVEG